MPNMTANHSLQQQSRLSCLSMPRPHAHARAIQARMSASCGPLDTLIKKFTNRDQGRRKVAELRLLTAIESTQRGLTASPSSKQEILDAVSELEDIGRDTVTTGSDLSATWRLLYTTEKASVSMLSGQWHAINRPSPISIRPPLKVLRCSLAKSATYSPVNIRRKLYSSSKMQGGLVRRLAKSSR